MKKKPKWIKINAENYHKQTKVSEQMMQEIDRRFPGFIIGEEGLS